MQPHEFLLGIVTPFVNRLLDLEAFLLGPHARFVVELSGLPMRFPQCAFGVLASGIGTLGDRHLAVVEFDFPLGDFVVEFGGAMNERLFYLMAVRLGVLARAFEFGGGLPCGARPYVSRFFLGRAQQLLHPVTEAALAARLLGQLLELRLERPQLRVGLFGPAVLALVSGLQFRDLSPQRLLILVVLGELRAQDVVRLSQFTELGDESLDVLIDLLPVITLTNQIEGSRRGWNGGSVLTLGSHVEGTH
jgi:hypothetical protein